MYEHIRSLLVEDTRAISSLCYNDVDLFEDEIPSAMIKMCINTLNSQHITHEEQALGYFTRKNLKLYQNGKNGRMYN